MKVSKFLLVLVLAMMFLAVSCSDSEGNTSVSDLCKDITCSDKGTCAISKSVATCFCYEGYSADGLTCIKDNTTVNPCDNIDCSDHGTCVVNDDITSCNCEEGYIPDGLTCIKDNTTVNPCDNIDCSGHGTCVVNDDITSCNCEEGYIPDALTCVEGISSTTYFDLSTEANDRFVYISTDEYGNTYSLGSTSGNFNSNLNYGKEDVFLAKHDSLGNLIWTKQYGGSENEYPSGLKVSNGNIYIYGVTYSNSFNNLNCESQSCGFLINLDYDSNIIWTNLVAERSVKKIELYHNRIYTLLNDFYFDSTGSSSSYILDIGVYTEGGVEESYNNVLNSRIGNPSSFTVDTDGNYYFVYNDYDGYSSVNGVLEKYDSNLNKLWSKDFSGTFDKTNRIPVTIKFNNGNIYIAGTSVYSNFNSISNTDSDYDSTVLMKLNTDGQVYWTKNYNTEGNSHIFSGFSFDSNNNIYLVTANHKGGVNARAYMLKYNSNGDFISENEILIESASKIYPESLHISESDKIYISGYVENSLNKNDAFFMRYIEE